MTVVLDLVAAAVCALGVVCCVVFPEVIWRSRRTAWRDTFEGKEKKGGVNNEDPGPRPPPPPPTRPHKRSGGEDGQHM